MRRILGGLVPLAMSGAVLFAAAPAATAAGVHPAAATCPSYGPGGCTGQESVYVTYNSNGTVTIHIVASGFKPGEQVNLSITVPNRGIGAFTAGGPSAASVSGASIYNGSISGTVQLPAGIPAGTHTITAVGSQSGVVASSTITLSHATGAVQPCTASISTAHASGVVLDAAFLSASCKTAAPAASAGGVPASGTPASGAPASAAPASSVSQAQASALPFTGFNAATWASIGAITVAAGGALVLVSRRRRSNAWK